MATKSSKKGKKKAKADRFHSTNVAHYILLGVAILVILAIIIIGFKDSGENEPPVIVGLSGDTTSEPVEAPTIPEEITDKQLYDGLLIKAEDVESYVYTLSDSELERENTFLRRLRAGVVLLEEPEEVNDNQFDKVYFDRVTKTALARCSTELCGERDIDLDIVDYDDYYELDPVEWMYKFKDPVLDHNTTIGNNVVLVFNVTTLDGEPGKIWLQEYYGFPFKFEFGERTVEFKDIRPNAVTLGDVMPPYNMTVGGTTYQFGWYSYVAKEFDEKFVI